EPRGAAQDQTRAQGWPALPDAARRKLLPHNAGRAPLHVPPLRRQTVLGNEKAGRAAEGQFSVCQPLRANRRMARAAQLPRVSIAAAEASSDAADARAI